MIECSDGGVVIHSLPLLVTYVVGFIVTSSGVTLFSDRSRYTWDDTIVFSAIIAAIIWPLTLPALVAVFVRKLADKK